MKAVILAAGLGTRLAPFTDHSPKILAWLNGERVLGHQLNYLAKHGFTDVAINTHHFSDQVEEFVAGDLWRTRLTEDTKVEIFHEEKLLGTAGSLLPMESFIGEEPFLVMYGDVIATFDLSDFASQYRADATIACYPVRSDVGIITLSDLSGTVECFEEKPDLIVSAGYYALCHHVLSYINEGDDFGYDTFPRLLDDDADVFAYRVNANQVIDVGTEAGLVKAYSALRGSSGGRLRSELG